ncbi:hypothetical protein [Rhodococcus kronopolitis]|uniref:Uncharacterized protein n=1 Tax=Rhodococcus kronopolitis TaxID=1460226 RepID=A0ABV9FR31_9NOCA
MALVTRALPDPRTAAKDLRVVSITDAPASAIAPPFLATGPNWNHPPLFAVAALSVLVGAVLVIRIKGVT